MKLGVGSVGVAVRGAAVFGYEFLSPNVLYEPSPDRQRGQAGPYPRRLGHRRPEAGIYIVHGRRASTRCRQSARIWAA